MGIDDRSNELFGRYQAFRVYAEIARLAKDEFTTGQIATLAGTTSADASKELARLVRLEVIARSRHGDYTRGGQPILGTSGPNGAVGLLVVHELCRGRALGSPRGSWQRSGGPLSFDAIRPEPLIPG